MPLPFHAAMELASPPKHLQADAQVLQGVLRAFFAEYGLSQQNIETFNYFVRFSMLCAHAAA